MPDNSRPEMAEVKVVRTRRGWRASATAWNDIGAYGSAFGFNREKVVQRALRRLVRDRLKNAHIKEQVDELEKRTTHETRPLPSAEGHS